MTECLLFSQHFKDANFVLDTLLHEANVSTACDLALVYFHLVEETHLRLYHIDLSTKCLGMIAHQFVFFGEELFVHLGEDDFIKFRSLVACNGGYHIFPFLW
jgi:hypothetical protein